MWIWVAGDDSIWSINMGKQANSKIIVRTNAREIDTSCNKPALAAVFMRLQARWRLALVPVSWSLCRLHRGIFSSFYPMNFSKYAGEIPWDWWGDVPWNPRSSLLEIYISSDPLFSSLILPWLWDKTWYNYSTCFHTIVIFTGCNTTMWKVWSTPGWGYKMAAVSIFQTYTALWNTPT